MAYNTICLDSGFQATGSPHVVGSIGLSVDQICAGLSHLFYQKICEADQG